MALNGTCQKHKPLDHLCSHFVFCLQMSQLKSAMIHDEFHLWNAWWMLRIFRAAAAINQDCRCSSAWLSQRDIGQVTTSRHPTNYPAKSSQNSKKKNVKTNHLLKDSMWKRCACEARYILAFVIVIHRRYWYQSLQEALSYSTAVNSPAFEDAWFIIMNHIESTKWFPRKPTSNTLPKYARVLRAVGYRYNMCKMV